MLYFHKLFSLKLGLYISDKERFSIKQRNLRNWVWDSIDSYIEYPGYRGSSIACFTCAAHLTQRFSQLKLSKQQHLAG